jgi:hypothetical protein
VSQLVLNNSEHVSALRHTDPDMLQRSRDEVTHVSGPDHHTFATGEFASIIS